MTKNVKMSRKPTNAILTLQGGLYVHQYFINIIICSCFILDEILPTTNGECTVYKKPWQTTHYTYVISMSH